MDLGSNSFHLLVAEGHPDGTFDTISSAKEMLRLGSQVAAHGVIGEPLAELAVETVRRFAAQAASLGASEILACATAAFREAEDSAAVVDRIEAETGVRVRLISGRQEAALIFSAVRSSVVIDPAPALALDLGGGSLELMVGDASGLTWAASVKLGVGRLTEELVRSDPPSSGDRRRLARAVVRALEVPLGQIPGPRPRLLIGSSGTLTTLIRLAAARRARPVPPSVNQLTVSGAELDKLGDDLLAMTSKERAALSGVDARRADLLPAGVVLLSTVMELTGLSSLTGCAWALREGMLLDAVRRHAPIDWVADPATIRRESVLALCRRCGYSAPHAEKVARLAVGLFDGTSAWHGLGPADRELLELGGLLHDIGEHISVEDHEHHSAYLIQHGRLRGFRPDEIAVLACLARFHRRGTPKASFEPFALLDERDRSRVTYLVALLQVADGLDRSHGGPVRSAAVLANRPGVVDVVVEADDDIDLELWGLRRKRELFERVFGRRLEVGGPQLGLPFDETVTAAVG